MLTLITFAELQKLYRDQKILKSESFDFLSENTKGFLGKVFKEEKEVEMANLIYVHSVDGKEITEVAREVLDDSNDDLLAYLPLLEGDQICLVVNTPEKVLQFSDLTLDELESTSLASEEEQEFYKEILGEGTTKDDSCAYAVASALNLKDVTAVLYPEEMEEQVAQLKEENKGREVLFKTTAMFS